MIHYQPGEDQIEAFIATGTAIALALAGASAGSSIYAAKKQATTARESATTQSDTALKSAQLQVDAENKAAELQSQTAAKQLAYEQEQARIAQANSEVNRRANYQQYAAGQRARSTIAQELGMGALEIPDYVPGVYDTAPAGGSTSTASGPMPSVDGSAASISAFFKSQGVSDQETPYWVSKWPELVARGQEIGDPQYALKRLMAADALGGGGAPRVTAPTVAKTPYTAATVGSLATPIAPAAMTASPVYSRRDPRVAGTIGGLAYNG